MELRSTLGSGLGPNEPRMLTDIEPPTTSSSGGGGRGSGSQQVAYNGLIVAASSSSGSDSGSDGESTPSASKRSGDDQYAPGAQKTKVEGEVLRWHHEHGLERIEAATYMEQLEQQVWGKVCVGRKHWGQTESPK